MNKSTPYELNHPRKITLDVGVQSYSFTLRRPAREDWMKYFDNIVSTSEQQGKEVIREFDNSRARLDLVESVLTDCSGYRIESVPLPVGWQSKLPMRHRLAIAEILLRVGPANLEDDSMPLALGSESVTIKALGNYDDEKHAMVLHSDLEHTFETPTWEHNRRYMRDLSRSKVVGGSRSGKTVWSGAQKTLAAIYDELIVSVSGYTWDGIALCDGTWAKSELVERMDTYHKVVAAQQLFNASEVQDDEAAE